MADFNALEWAELYESRKAKPRDFNADAAEAVGTQEALRAGQRPDMAMISGMQARQTMLDPLSVLKRAKLQTDILVAAQEFQEGILSQKIKAKQIDDEAADTLAASQLPNLPDDDKRLEFLNTHFWKSARGIANATQWRQQISLRKQKDWLSRSMATISQKDPALAMRLSTMDPSTPEFFEALRSFKPAALTLAETRNFLKRLDAIDPATRQVIEQMSDPEQQKEALSRAEAAVIEAARNAVPAGSLQTTTIGPGGVTTTFREPPQTKAEVEPKVESFGGREWITFGGKWKPVALDTMNPKQKAFVAVAVSELKAAAQALRETTTASVKVKRQAEYDKAKANFEALFPEAAREEVEPTAAPKRVLVKGPNGERGTIVEGTPLAEGWSLE